MGKGIFEFSFNCACGAYGQWGKNIDGNLILLRKIKFQPIENCLLGPGPGIFGIIHSFKYGNNKKKWTTKQF